METRDGIRIFRERAGFKSQADLAKALGIIPQNVSVWEIGKGFPSFQVAKKLLELGATVEEVFGISYSGELQNRTPLTDLEAGAIVKQGLSFLFGKVG